MAKIEDVVAKQAAQDERLKNIEKTCNEIKIAVQGDSKSLGLGTRVFVLEGKAKTVGRIVWLLTGGVVTICAGFVVQYLGGKN